jgi:PIN domain nuclease of toxin-antitoxin system
MTRLLLDTHIFVWAKTAHKPLKRSVAEAIVDPANEVMVSLASAWELCIKAAVRKLIGDASLLIGSQQKFESVLSESNFRLLDIRAEHVFAVRHLPLHHRDPFDRLIVAQAMAERMTLVTADRSLDAYAGLDLIVGA